MGKAGWDSEGACGGSRAFLGILCQAVLLLSSNPAGTLGRRPHRQGQGGTPAPGHIPLTPEGLTPHQQLSLNSHNPLLSPQGQAAKEEQPVTEAFSLQEGPGTGLDS